MSEEEQILETLNEAESRVARLKALIMSRSERGLTVPEQHRDSLVEKNHVFSRDEFFYTRYMTLSTVKLFENKGIEVFKLAGSVGLFFICPNSPVRTAARSAVLRIVRISDKDRDDVHPPAFIQVGDWVYPLLAGSMVYRSKDQFYLFPDLIATVPGSSVGVVLPKTCSPSERNKFESLLLGFSGLTSFPDHPPPEYGHSTDLIMSARTSVTVVKTSSGIFSQPASQDHTQYQSGGGSGEGYGKRIGAGIKAGGELLSRGIELGAIGTANAICLGASCLKSSLPKEENDREIPCIIADGIVGAQATTEKVVELSSTLLATLGEITSDFAGLTACYVRAASAPLVTRLVEASGLSQETIDAVATEMKDLGEGIVGGTADAYRGLENAARIMASAINSNTAELVEHCYGPSAARVLQNAGNVVGNMALSGYNAGQAINPPAIISKTVKKTGIAIAAQEC